MAVHNQNFPMNTPEQTTASSPTSASLTSSQQNMPPVQSTPANYQVNEPHPQISDSEAQALLTVNNFQAKQSSTHKIPLGVLITIAVLIVLVLITGYLLSALNGKGSSPVGNLGLPNQSPPSNSRSVSNQINQDVNACSNPVNATLVC